MDKMEIFTLDLFSCLLPVLLSLLDSMIERYPWPQNSATLILMSIIFDLDLITYPYGEGGRVEGVFGEEKLQFPGY